MPLKELVAAALELGIVPALALFLVAAMFAQNRQLINDKRAMEARLLDILSDIVMDNQKTLERLYASKRQAEEKED